MTPDEIAAAGASSRGSEDSTKVVAFRRPKPEDALELALATFLRGERVEMGRLAAELGISLPTLYRWVGTREQLLDCVLGRVARDFAAAAAAELKEDGDARVVELVRRTMSSTAGFEPGRSFVAREPQLALRLVLGKESSAHRAVAGALSKVIRETRPSAQVRALASRVDLIIHVCTGLEWAAIAVGDEPDLEGALEVVRALLSTAR